MTCKILGLAFAALAVVGVAGGCSESSEDEGGSGRGVRGETCVATPDCGSGLACVGGVCSVRSFSLMVTQNECVLIECTEPKDCLDPICRAYEIDCSAGDTVACDNYDSFCDETEYLCEDDLCVELCEDGIDCSEGGACVNGRCTDCGSDDDCSTDYVCVSGTCVQGCEEKADCPYFHDCENGQCVYTGCSVSRECIAATGSARAVCEAKECIVPCDTDIECDEPNSFDFVQCVSGRCMPIGCESDSECRIRLDIDITPDNDDAACRPASSTPTL